MVCIAAFIILAIMGVFVAIVSIFKPEVGRKYRQLFKRAWTCVGKKARLQKCETGFKEDIKNTILAPLIVKHPKWVKPVSVALEVVSVVIVAVAVWAILTAVKSLLALWALGTCNVTQPAACSLGAEVCSIDESEPQNLGESIGRWFTEWGEIFEAIPDKFHEYKAEDYEFNYISVPAAEAEAPVAVDIMDPGCSICLQSYVNQKNAGFFDEYNVRVVPYAIQSADGEYKFANSEVIVRYMLAAEQLRSGVAAEILDRVFTWKNDEGMQYQGLFNNLYSRDEAVAVLEEWLGDMRFDRGAIAEVRTVAAYPEITDKMQENREIVENQLHAKGIPTMIYDGSKHTGLWKAG